MSRQDEIRILARWKSVLACISVLGLWAIDTGVRAAEEWELSGYVAAELRLFTDSPGFVEQQDRRLSPSLQLEPEVVYQWNGGDDRLTVVPFLRFDGTDDHRSHVDLREANWLHIGEDWDLVIGFDKVFWGVTESRHLVDIINQDDGVEDIDGEDKFGQPMINLNLLRSWGRTGIFVLPSFRERNFPANDARLRGSLPIAEGAATFESGAGNRHTDLAFRWSNAIGPWDMGLAYFHGTSREPRFFPRIAADGGIQLVPHYDQIDQISLDVQLTRGAWLWKLEAIYRSGYPDRFAATVGGFEFTQYGIFGTGADIGFLAEYLYDGRDSDDGRGNARAPPTVLDDDIFLGTRLSLNDIQDTSALLGAIVDADSGAAILFVEAARRIGSRWKFELESRLFSGVPRHDPLAGIRRDSFITVRLSWYF